MVDKPSCHLRVTGYLILGFVLLHCCERIEPERLILIRTGTVSDVSYTSCVVNGMLLDVGESGVTQHGFCTSLTPNLKDATESAKLGPKSARGNYTGNITGLQTGTEYYLWAFASGEGLTVYGEPVQFNTLAVEPPLMETGNPFNITFQSAECTGNVSTDGGSTVTARGICWSMSPSPTVNNAHCSSGTGTGDFACRLEGLEPDNRYYVRAYAINSSGTGYGNEKEFTTLPEPTIPQLITHEVQGIESTEATCGGTITDDGGSTVIAKGLCWSIHSLPTLFDDHLVYESGGTDPFSIPVAGLVANTRYFIRAYATNSSGTGYGNEEEFITLPEPTIPQLITHEVQGIESTEATCGGTITDDGGSEVITRGLCWSTHPMPTLSDIFLPHAGGGTDPFTIKVTGLLHNTLYYIRAFATTDAGTGYGNEQEFRTSFECGSQLVDQRDGKVYNTVSIGGQCWMAENLNVGEMILSDAEPVVESGIEKYCLNNEPSQCDVYGGLYAWGEMMQYTLVESAQGVCPEGWHIPSDFEWKVMERAIGMSVAASDSASWRGTNEGGKLKAPGTAFWNPPNEGATNSTLFSALPSGMMYSNGSFAGTGDFAVYWTSTPILETQAWYRYLHTNEARIYRVDGSRPNTTPVRCVKD